MQYFLLHSIFPFSQSYPEIGNTWPNAKCRGRKSFDTWCYIVTCATLCVRFSSNWKQLVFFPNILKLKADDQWIQARKKLFCHTIVNNYVYNESLWKFLIKIESTWRREIKEQAPQLTWQLPPELSYKKFQNFCNIHRNHLWWSLFLKKLQTFRSATVLKRDLNAGVVNIAKFLILPILKNICQQLDFNFFNGSLLATWT